MWLLPELADLSSERSRGFGPSFSRSETGRCGETGETQRLNEYFLYLHGAYHIF
jgi:hypothetical protein